MLRTSLMQDKFFSMLGLKAKPTIDIILDPHPQPKFWRYVDSQDTLHKLPVYRQNDSLSGIVNLTVPSKVDHLGLRVQLIGHLQIFNNASLSTDFTLLSKELEPAGSLTSPKSYKFTFENFEKPYESFNGIMGRVRYFVRGSMAGVMKEVEFAVLKDVQEEEFQAAVCIEVGIEECLQVSLQYNKANYHLKDCLLGKVSFDLVKIPLKQMDIDIERRQILGTQIQKKTLVKYEIVDGCPANGEVVPFRIYLTGVPLTPTYKNIHNRLQVKHYLNFVLIDVEGRRYFKQQEMEVFRKKKKK